MALDVTLSRVIADLEKRAKQAELICRETVKEILSKAKESIDSKKSVLESMIRFLERLRVIFVNREKAMENQRNRVIAPIVSEINRLYDTYSKRIEKYKALIESIGSLSEVCSKEAVDIIRQYVILYMELEQEHRAILRDIKRIEKMVVEQGLLTKEEFLVYAAYIWIKSGKGELRFAEAVKEIAQATKIDTAKVRKALLSLIDKEFIEAVI